MLRGIDVCITLYLRPVGLEELLIVVKMLICLVFGIFGQLANMMISLDRRVLVLFLILYVPHLPFQHFFVLWLEGDDIPKGIW